MENKKFKIDKIYCEGVFLYILSNPGPQCATLAQLYVFACASIVQPLFVRPPTVQCTCQPQSMESTIHLLVQNFTYKGKREGRGEWFNFLQYLLVNRLSSLLMKMFYYLQSRNKCFSNCFVNVNSNQTMQLEIFYRKTKLYLDNWLNFYWPFNIC